MLIFGTTGDDIKPGTEDADLFVMGDGGNDFCVGLGGNDIFGFGDTFSAGDVVWGGDGYDYVTVSSLGFRASNGGYQLQPITYTMLSLVEEIDLGPSGSNGVFAMNFDNAVVPAGQTLTIWGKSLAYQSVMFVDASASSGNFWLRGGAGSNTLIGGSGNDYIDLVTGGGGLDYGSANGGNDTIDGGANLAAIVQIDGGGGDDLVRLEGDYSGVLSFDSTVYGNPHSRLEGVETLLLMPGYSYAFAANDMTVAAGAAMIVDASQLSPGQTLSWNGTAETDGRYDLRGGAGTDVLLAGGAADTVSGGGGEDRIDLSRGGIDVADGGSGDDTVAMGTALTADDRLDGGSGFDELDVTDAVLVLAADTVKNFEGIRYGGSTLALTLADGTAAAGASLQIAADPAFTGQALIDGSAETDAHLFLYGGSSPDTLVGGSIGDQLTGNGQDRLVGGPGDDTYVTNGRDIVVEAPNAGLDVVLSTASFKLGANVETLVLANGADIDGTGNSAANTLLGNNQSNVLDGLGGNDTIGGGGGFDILKGGGGDDRLDGGPGTDTLIGDIGNDTYVNVTGDVVFELPDEGTDTIVSDVSLVLPANVEILRLGGTGDAAGTGNELANLLFGSAGANLLSGLDGADTLTGGDGTDTLAGGDGDDELRGGAGADRMSGGLGNDRFFVDDAGDQTVETNADPATGGIDTVFSTVIRTLAANIENLRLQGSGDLNGNGNELANKLFGNSGANILKGLGGADTIDGKGGADTIDGGEGNDTLSGGGGADVFRFAASNAGVDRILDFSRNFDRFDLSGGAFTALSIAPNGDAVLTHAGGTIRVATPPNLTLDQWNTLVLPSGGRTAHDTVAIMDSAPGAGLLRHELALAHADWLHA